MQEIDQIIRKLDIDKKMKFRMRRLAKRAYDMGHEQGVRDHQVITKMIRNWECGEQQH